MLIKERISGSEAFSKYSIEELVTWIGVNGLIACVYISDDDLIESFKRDKHFNQDSNTKLVIWDRFAKDVDMGLLLQRKNIHSTTLAQRVALLKTAARQYCEAAIHVKN